MKQLNGYWSNAGKQLQKDIKGYWKGFVLAGITLFLCDRYLGYVCAARFLIGIPCPACGMTRALFLFVSGNPIKAFYMNPIYPFVIIGLVYFIICRYLLKKSSNFMEKYVIITLLLSILVYAYRMVYWFPDREPMLYERGNILEKTLIYFLGGQ